MKLVFYFECKMCQYRIEHMSISPASVGDKLVLSKPGIPPICHHCGYIGQIYAIAALEEETHRKDRKEMTHVFTSGGYGID